MHVLSSCFPQKHMIHTCLLMCVAIHLLVQLQTLAGFQDRSKLATQDQLVTAARVRHPALRKTTAISDEMMEEENTTAPESLHWDGSTASTATKRSTNPPTATIVCTKSEPLCSEDIGIIPTSIQQQQQLHQRNTLPIHAHSVPPMRSSRLHDISAMNTVGFPYLVHQNT